MSPAAFSFSSYSADSVSFSVASTVSGQVRPPVADRGASGNNLLDTQQRAAVIGEPVPIVFCRRENGSGGVLISPPATECRFENDDANNLTASYHLVLSEGRIGSIQVRDVFQIGRAHV